MLRFFDSPDTQWRSLKGCLHLYAVPEPRDPIRDDFARMARPLATISGLGLQPERYMHVTVQRFDAYVSDLGNSQWTEFLGKIPEIVRHHPSFEVQFTPPLSRRRAVEAIGQVSPEWTHLLTDLRNTVSEVGLANALTEPPHAPHYTLAYCVKKTDDQLVNAALKPEATPTRFRINRLMLVAVDQDPAAGTFTFDPIEEWSIGARLPAVR